MRSTDGAVGPALTRTEGPVGGGVHGWPFGAATSDLAAQGYVEEEFFVSGDAVRYQSAGDLGADGRWTVAANTTCPYRTRALVRRPSSPAVFTGTVVVEWVNVSAGYEVNLAEPSQLDGHAYVAVSAQPTGVHGFPSQPAGLRTWDPERYGSLDVPDDSVGYDIYTQVARLLRDPGNGSGPALLRSLRAGLLIGVGASQSGTRVLAYANAIQPVEGAFDALMPLICAGMAADFDAALAHPDRAAGQTGHSRSRPTRVRADLRTPVLALNTETEALHFALTRQPDSDWFRSWEIAGASHVPSRQLARQLATTRRDGMPGPGWASRQASDVPWLPTFDAAIMHVRRWVTEGTPPPAQPPIEITLDGTAIVRDDHGNARGGIRLPELDVPIASYRGSAPEAPLTGATEPFPAPVLARLYPSHEDYVSKVAAAAAAALDAGVILPHRAAEYVELARATPVPPADRLPPQQPQF